MILSGGMEGLEISNDHSSDEQVNAPPASLNSRSRRRSLLDAGPFVLLFATLAGSFGAWHWALDLFSHFRWYYFLISLVWIVVICRSDRRKSIGSLAFALIWNGGLLWPYYIPAAQSAIPKSAATVSLISVNVHTANQNKAAVVDYLRQRQPDLVVVMEIDLKWADALRALKDIYPHQFLQPRPDNFGIGVLSRQPLIEPRFSEFGDTGLPNVVTQIDVHGRKHQLIATHPLPPVGAERYVERNAQLRALGDFVNQSTLPTIVAGDLNATPWSVAFRDLIARSNLRDSSLGRGIHGTWNAKSWVRIPIDHVLIPAKTTVVSRAVGPDVGSDHFPVEITVAIP